MAGSEVMWFWLAKIIRGNNQHDRTNSGVDNGSVAKYRFDVDHPISESHFNHVRLTAAIIKLWNVIVVHSHFLLINQVVGISIIVGIRTFNIVVGLGFLGGLCRVFVMWLPVGPGPRWPHRQRMLEVLLALRRMRLSLSGKIIGLLLHRWIILLLLGRVGRIGGVFGLGLVLKILE